MAKKSQPNDISRRDFLQWLGAGAVLGLSGAALVSCGSENDSGITTVPDGPGEYPFQPGDTLGDVFKYWGERTVDPQDLEYILANWKLRVDGLVDRPATYSFADLVALPQVDQIMDFHCVEGWSIYDVPWNGLHISELLDRSGRQQGITHVTFHTIDGHYNESLPIDIALEAHTLLAYGIAGNTIPFKHGFPLRVVIPRLLAYKSAKYIDRIEFTNGPVEGFWVERGYPYDADVPEDRLRNGRY